MNLYLDSSALVKLYVVEEGSSDVERWIAESDDVWTSAVAYAEACAALSRRARDGSLTDRAHARVLKEVDRDWAHLNVLNVEGALAQMAGVLTHRHGLKGFDAIHLASSIQAELLVGSLVVAVYDLRLRRAAAAEGQTLAG